MRLYALLCGFMQTYAVVCGPMGGSGEVGSFFGLFPSFSFSHRKTAPRELGGVRFRGAIGIGVTSLQVASA